MQLSLTDQIAILAAIGEDATLAIPGETDATIRIIYKPENSIIGNIISDRPTAVMKAGQLDGIDIKTAELSAAGETWRMFKPLPRNDGFLLVGLNRQ